MRIGDADFQAELAKRFTADCDPWGTAAEILFSPQAMDLAVEGDKFHRRQLVKQVFHRIFPLVVGRFVQSEFDYAGHVAEELKQRGLFDEISATVSAKMRAEDDKKNT